MQKVQEYYPECPEALIVGLARGGDKDAFEELVRRRQSQVRNLMRRLSSDTALADDLAQLVFLQMWLRINALRSIEAFNGWLRRIAVTAWLQHIRKADVLSHASDTDDPDVLTSGRETPAIALDLDHALSLLKPDVRLCVVLSYQEGLTHAEISSQTDIPPGTVKSHIKRGTESLRQLLSAYTETDAPGDKQ